MLHRSENIAKGQNLGYTISKGFLKGARQMNPYNLDITKIVKYVCMTAVAIVGIIFSCHTFQKMFETQAALEYDRSWNDEE